MPKILNDIDLGGVARVTGALDGVADSDLATVRQLNSAVEGLAWKDSARVATQGNINLASPGATVDGIAMAPGDRILIRAQTAGPANGLYVWNGAAVAATRAPDASTAAELEAAVVTVEEGTSAGATYRQTAVNFTLGTDPVAWTAFGTAAGAASEASPGIIEIATQAETDAGTDDARAVTPLKLSSWSGRTRRATANIGDGAATQFDLTHNFGTRDVTVEVVRAVAPYDTVYVDTSRPDLNTVRLNFAAAPTTGQYRVLARA